VRRGLEHVQLGRDIEGPQRAVEADGVGQQDVTGAGREQGRWEPGEIAEDR